ncbi:Mbov_0399 family ICE element protein [Mycoplasma enhydrae]|uniref:Mbov_0399 family ICE element protein n=1 Tax=Mycoplasma enhydrae TaxID=2499220 RepID=UPI00197B7DA4|nr:hypothetical protein [Mycoplasma enhydrae]MBN4089696.1 hypothetical protein [Mycoplasma enhydrae]
MKKSTKILIAVAVVGVTAATGLGISACQRATIKKADTHVYQWKNEWINIYDTLYSQRRKIKIDPKYINIDDLRIVTKRTGPKWNNPSHSEKIEALKNNLWQINDKLYSKFRNYIDKLGIKDYEFDGYNGVESYEINYLPFYSSYDVNTKDICSTIKYGRDKGRKHCWKQKTGYTYFVKSIHFEYPRYVSIKLKSTAQPKAFDYFQNYLSTFISRNQDLKIEGDYLHDKIDNFKINKPEFELFRTNEEAFLEWAKKLDDKRYYYDGEMWQLKYEIAEDRKHISIFMVNSALNAKNYLIKNQKIVFTKSNKYDKLNIISKLQITEKGQYLTFDNLDDDNPTGIKEDKEIRIENDKPIGLTGSNYYLGTYILHTPSKFSFKAPNDNYVVKINGKIVDVINNKFDIALLDKRSNPDDKTREHFDNADKSKPKDEQNSYQKNEYTIAIEEYDNINLDTSPKTVYTKKYIIETKPGALDFKWYAWDPENNPNQRELIEEYLIDENGKVKENEQGLPIKNPKFDPLVDKQTGTKKEVVWINTEGIKHIANSEVGKSSFEIKYAQKTGLPYFAYTLFNSRGKLIRDKGFIAEAIVLSKAALKQLIGITKEYYMVPIDKHLWEDTTKTKYWANPEKLDNKVSSNSYISTEGLYLFYSRSSKHEVNNFKLVLIKNDDNVLNKTFSQINKIDNINNLWATSTGKFFAAFLEKTENIKKDQLKYLKYEKVKEYWGNYVTYLNKNSGSEIDILPRFDFSSENNKFDSKQEFLEYIKENNINIVDKYGDFKYKELVNIESMNFLDENTLELSFSLKTADDRYKLLAHKQTYAISFKNFKLKEIIDIKWDLNFIHSKSKSLSKNRFIKWVKKNNLDLILNSNNHKQKLEFDYYLIDNQLTLKFNLKKEFINDYKLNGNNITLDLQFLDADLFDDFESNIINLSGENRPDKIKNIVLMQIFSQIKGYLINLGIDIAENDLKFEKDFELKLEKMTKVHLNYDQALSNKINVEVVVKNHPIEFEIINFSNSKISKPINLEDLSIDLIDINLDTSWETEAEYGLLRQKIANKLKEILQNELKKFNDELILGTNVIFHEPNFETIINNLFFKDIISEFEIFSNHPLISNKLLIKVTNSHPKAQTFDLNLLVINDLKIELKSFEKIKSEIIKWIDFQIKSNNLIINLFLNEDYEIENINDKEFLKNLVKAKGLNTLDLKIKSKGSKTTESTSFKVINNFDGELTSQDKKNWVTPKPLSPLAIALIATGSTIGLISIVLLSLLIYRRKTAKTK